MQELTIDPEFQDLCPPLSPEERSLLEARIEADGGCFAPIIVWANHDNIILDGHNRYAICRQFGWSFETKEMEFQDRDSCIEWIATHQLGRRNLSEEQKAYLRGKRYRAEKSGHGGVRKSSDNRCHLKTSERLATEYGVHPNTIRNDSKFAEDIDAIGAVSPQVKQAILSGKVKASRKAIRQAAKVPTEERAEAAAELLHGKPSPPESFDVVVVPELSSIAGKFTTIYADPPWQYGNQGTRAATNNHYSTMTVDEICALPVADIAADEALLFLWTTNGFLEESLTKVIPAWGFTFKSSMVWVKPQMGIGNYVRNAHEFLLIANRGGKLPTGKSQISWIASDRGKHSKKPMEFRLAIEKMAPQPRIELFAREQVEGWTVWGNQIEKGLFDDKCVRRGA